MDSKPIVRRNLTGRVKFFNVSTGYGFIKSDYIDHDIFVHQSGIAKANPNSNQKSLAQNERVKFDLAICNKGFEAKNVTGPNGEPVIGSNTVPEQNPRMNNNRRNY